MTKEKYYLGADVGGTNIRIRLVNSKSDMITEKEYKSSDYSSLESILETFLKDKQKPVKACIAVAGAVIDGTCQLTNLPSWPILDEKHLSEKLGFKVTLINDFVANAYHIVFDKNKEIFTLQEGNYNPNTPICIMGAGTGLGKAFAIPFGNNIFKVFPSEGGHTNFAPRKDIEDILLRALTPKYQNICQEKFKLSSDEVKHLSIDEEAILSGPGIVDIFQVLKDFYSDSLAQEILVLPAERQPEEIAISATKKNNPLAEKTMEIFIEAYGSICGNFAVNFLPFGGLYIAGGIAAKNIDLIKEKKDLFLKAFNTKVRVNPELLKRVPIHIVTNELSGLEGVINYVTKM